MGISDYVIIGMDFHVLGLELIFYKNGKVNLVTLDGEMFYVGDPTEDDSSVYKIVIGKKFSKRFSIIVHSVDENITELFRSDVELPKKLVTDSFAAIFECE